jgi:O-antigen/teichoic acid export membrane protein
VKQDVIWGYLSQFLQYGAALLVLPLLLKRLSSAELGVWYVFMTISALVTMLDMGFTPTLARNVSYVLGGAKQIHKHGHEVIETPGAVDYGLLNAMIKASRRIFMVIALGALVILATLGSWYIAQVTRGQVDGQTAMISWAVFVAATVINLYYKYYTPLLQGRSLFAAFYKSSSIANLSFVVVSALLLQLDFGLLAVALGYFASALVGRWLSWRYFYDQAFKECLEQAPLLPVHTAEIFRILWHNAWRMGLGVFGGFLIVRASTLLSSAYLGLATTAAYALTLQVYSVLQNMATVVFNVQQPRMARYRVSNQKAELRRTIEVVLGCALALFLVGAAFVICLGSPLIRLIGGHTELLPLPMLIWVGIMVLLELNHSLSAAVIVTGNQVPFVKPALFSGVAIVLFSWLGLRFGGAGLEWLIATQFVVQLVYNNWKWPWMVWVELYGRPQVAC